MYKVKTKAKTGAIVIRESSTMRRMPSSDLLHVNYEEARAYLGVTCEMMDHLLEEGIIELTSISVCNHKFRMQTYKNNLRAARRQFNATHAS